ncbi:unnamed protein product [Closterium sp. NIES-54]
MVHGGDHVVSKGVTRAAKEDVGEMQVRAQRSTAAAGSLHNDTGGRCRSPQQSAVGPSSATHVTAGGIAPAYGYFNFPPNKIVVPNLLEDRHDLITWTKSIEPQLEIAGLKLFADGGVETPDEADIKLRAEFRSAHLLTFMIISRCYSLMV